MSFDGLLIHTLAISRRGGSSDGAGGFTLDYAPLSSVRGRMSTAGSGSKEIVLGEKWDAIVTHIAFMRPTDIRRDDRISLDGVNYRVIQVKEPSRFGHHLEVLCEQIQVKEPDNYGE